MPPMPLGSLACFFMFHIDSPRIVVWLNMLNDRMPYNCVPISINLGPVCIDTLSWSVLSSTNVVLLPNS